MVELRSDVKRHFKNRMPKFWEPESDQARLKTFYIKQRSILRQLFDPTAKTILDAGTGKGRFAIDFALNGAKRVFAIDISSGMLKIAKERSIKANVAEKIHFQQGDIENLAFDEDVFDVACCMETFVHLGNPQKAMNELARVTKTGGIVIANATMTGRLWKIRYRYGWSGLIRRALSTIYWSRICGSLRPYLHQKLGTPLTHKTLKDAKDFPKREFLSLLQYAKLEVMKTVEQGLWHFPVFLIVVARKPK